MKKIEEQYKKLDEIDHVLLRPGRYLGSITTHTSESWVFENNKAVLKENSYVPAFIKIFDEVISNSVDHSKREEGKTLDTIKVNIDQATGKISIFDNGGIPVIKHTEYDQYIPEMIFELRAGSNFDDNDSNVHLIGQNGEGAGLTNIMSTSFLVETCDGKNSFTQEHTNNSRNKTEPKIKKAKINSTKITYSPEYSRFNLDKLDDGNYAKLVKRVYDVAGCNPKLKIFLNDEQIKIKSFEDYIQMYTDDYVYDENEYWRIGVSKSGGSFSHVSFVNGSETSIGGNHIGYVADQLTTKIREYILKKHKIQIKPSEIKNHINLFIDCNIVKPRFSSQTKEDMITEVRNFGTTFDVNDKFIGKIIKSDIIQSILDWAQAKENAMLMAELRKLNKNTDKVDPIRVPKFDDANEKRDRTKCTCFLTEGDSASKSILSARDPRLHAVFALKGKPINVGGVDPKKLMDNDEFKNILTITGLKLGVPVTDKNQLRFGKICIMADADCLTKNHSVVAESGEVKIDELSVGDYILTHSNEYKKVTAIYQRYADSFIRFETQNAVVECTDNHRLAVQNGRSYSFLVANEIQLFDSLKTTNSYEKIMAITHVYNTSLVYDITVEDDHTFYVRHDNSKTQVLSHNCDGIHINGLVINMLYAFWPELFTLGIVHRFVTPLIKVYLNNETLNFYNDGDYLKWKSKNTKKCTIKYFKGLGTSTTKDFKEYLADMNKHLIKFEIEDQSDHDAINLAFSKDSGKSNNRKDWLDILGD
jgi:DNA gyrase/topoisomerase IV subunit B